VDEERWIDQIDVWGWREMIDEERWSMERDERRDLDDERLLERVNMDEEKYIEKVGER
jgi:hypothetical protein